MKWSRLNINWSKTILFVSVIKQLGVIISTGGKITIDPVRVSKLVNFPTPTTKTLVRSFLQACQISRAHIEHFAEYARPLTRLTGTKIPFEWTSLEENSFQVLKDKIKTAVERNGFDDAKKAILESDASAYAGGCIIKQPGDTDERFKELIILYDSFPFTPTEQRYSTYKRELCAIVHFIKKWQCYLGGIRETIVRTDHKPLLGFQDSAGKGKVEGIYARWAETLEMANLTWEYIPGTRNRGADAMSRLFEIDVGDTIDPDNFSSLLTSLDIDRDKLAEDLSPEYQALPQDLRIDPNYIDILKYLFFARLPSFTTNPDSRRRFARKCRDFFVHNNRLYYKPKCRHDAVLCLTGREIPEVSYLAHDRTGHFALRETFKIVAKIGWWPTRRSDILQYIASCFECTQFGDALRFEPLHPILTFQPFDLLGMDFIGPLPITSGGFRYIFHLIDYFSRFSHAWATLKDDEATVIDCLSHFFSYFCRPIAIYSDRGTHFASQVREFLLRQGIEHIKTSSYSSYSAGMIERRNGMLSSIMAKYINTDGNTDEWDSHVDEATRQLNFHEIGYLGYTPFQILFGIERRLPMSCFRAEISAAIC